MSRTDENALRALFEEIAAPAGLDRWRERIADVHVEACDREPDDDPEPARETSATIITFPTGGDLRPKRQRKRSVAAAAAAAVVVGLGGLVVTTQLFSDSPPADPPMIIDGPSKTDSSSVAPTSGEADASGVQSHTQPPPGPGASTPGGPSGGGQPGGNGGQPGTNPPAGGNEPTWPPMNGDPTAANTGVPLNASLGDHFGDLRITTAGQVVTDLRVTGSVIVDAPNVTLRRVLVVAQAGTPAVRQNAGGLTIENSELSGGVSLTQGAGGLVVRRSRLEAGITITSGAQVFDSFLGSADVLVPSGSTSVLLRHNTMDRVSMSDIEAPIRGVTIENSLLTTVDVPTAAGSASIYVLGNRFRGNAPSTGWTASATDFRWSGNTFVDSGAPANP
jgi:hypothetical protein